MDEKRSSATVESSTMQSQLRAKFSSALQSLYDPSALFDLNRQLILWILLFCSAIFLLTAVVNAYLQIPSVQLQIGMCVICMGIYWIARKNAYWAHKLTLFPFVAYLVVTTNAWFVNAGIVGSVPIYLTCPAITAIAILKGSRRMVVLVILFLHVVFLSLIQFRYPATVLPYSSPTTAQIDILIAVLLVILYCLGVSSLVMHHLDQRRQQAEALLLNVLPLPIAQKMAYRYTGAETIAQSFPQASIIFVDIVNFTGLSARMRPDELVSFLNNLFSHFDMLAEAYGIEKIKTIGDCYMAAAGVPSPRADHAHVLIRFALTLQAHIKRQQFWEEEITFRIGINSGPVVAGIIGKQKFAYDLWGDAVNLASRMESQGEPGMIQITRTTYEAIVDSFLCVYKGKLDIKGKGATEIWHVSGVRPEAAPPAVNRMAETNRVINQLPYREHYANSLLG